MKAVALNGSPYKGGNTEMLINEVSKPVQEASIETELAQLGGKLPRDCASCYTCLKTKDGQCVIKIDPVNESIRKAQEVDGIILASPTHYGSVSTEMKAFMDRLRLITIGQGCTLTCKVGVAVISVRRGGAVTAYDELNRFMLGSEMIVPGSTYWNSGIGEMPGEVYDDAGGSRDMEDLGAQLAWLPKAVHDR